MTRLIPYLNFMNGVCTSCGASAELNDEENCPDCAGEMEKSDDENALDMGILDDGDNGGDGF